METMKKTYLTPAVVAVTISDETLLCASDQIGITSTKGDNNAAVLSRRRDDFFDDED